MSKHRSKSPQGKSQRRRRGSVLWFTMTLVLVMVLFPPTRRAADWSSADASYAHALDRHLFGYIPRYQAVFRIGECESNDGVTSASIVPHPRATFTDYCWVVDWHWASIQAAVAVVILGVGLWRRRSVKNA